MSTRIGCDSLYYAKMTTEDTISSAPVYATPVAAPGVLSVGINPNAAQETLFADDGPMETATTLGKIEVEIKKNELTALNKADLLGHVIDSNGGVIYGDSDVPPFVAIGFRTLKSNGKYRYVWLYKGKFMDPEDNNETKGDGINFNTETIKGNFLRLNKNYTIGSKTYRPWKYEIDGDTANASAAVMAAWFNAVTMPSTSAASAAPTLTIAIAAGSVSGSTKATMTGSVAAGNKLVQKVYAADPGIPFVGDVISGAATYVSAANITGVVATNVLYLYELDTATNAVVKYYTKTLVSGDIMA